MRATPLVAWLVVFWAGAVLAQTPVPEDLVKQGRALVSKGQLDDAVSLYRQAIRLAPQSFDARLAMGIVLDLQGQYAEARTHLTEAIRRAPVGARTQAVTTLALSWVFDGRALEAVKSFEPVYKQQLTDQDLAGAAASANAIGRVFLEHGDFANAKKWYEQGIQHARAIPSLTPSERDLWELRWLNAAARMAAREGRADDARKHVATFEQTMQRRARLSDDNESYRYLLGYVSYYTKDYDRAIAELAQGNLSDPFISVLLGMAYEAKGDITNARQYYRRTLEINAHNLQNALARPYARAKLSGASQ